MGIFDFFKKQKIEDNNPKTIDFKNLSVEISQLKQEFKEKEKEPKERIKTSLSELLQELEQGRILLEEISLENKKAPERAKLIVKENLNKFEEYLGKLVSDLKELEFNSLETLIDRTQTRFSEFEKRSMSSFEKSTFLIGKELGNVRESITRFYKTFNKIIKENEQLIKENQTLLVIEKKAGEVENINKNILENENELLKIEEKIKIIEKEIQDFKREIEEKKKSPEYLKQIKTLQEIERLNARLLVELQRLRELVDFKVLTRVYHSIENKMRMIKEYRDNFKETFEKYGADRLKELASVREIDIRQIDDKIKLIEEIKKTIQSLNADKDLTEELDKKIISSERKKEDAISGRLEKQKRAKRLIENREKIKGEIIIELRKLNFILNN